MYAVFVLAWFACASEIPLPRTLAPPPSTPNCVSTDADPSDAVHFIEPIRTTPEGIDGTWARLHEVVSAMPRVTLVEETPDYRHYVFTTRIFRFRDDVQFVLDREQGLIRFRSASRVGRSDLGVNRRRMESVRAAVTPAP